MAKVELIMPKMGESITEATILKWNKNVGDQVEEDEAVLEIATDKVDSEVPSTTAGTISEILYKEGDVVEVGKAIAVIATVGEEVASAPSPAPAEVVEPTPAPVAETPIAAPVTDKPVQAEPSPIVSTPVVQATANTSISSNGNGRFYSPLVMNIARSENISMQELENLAGSGNNNRVTKKDILAFVSSRGNGGGNITASASSQAVIAPNPAKEVSAVAVGSGDEIVEMDRMRKLIADHMVRSKAISPHVTSFVEADVTNMVNWRNKVKKEFEEREGTRLTFTPLFIEAVVKAIKDFKGVNASVDGDNIIIRKDINIGMAAALPTGALIVPVIKNADQMNLVGLATRVNDLASRARNNKLTPDEISGGTFTLTNVGTFGNLMGTPIINQPQVAILATGSINKKAVVIETEHGDMIGIRHMMFLSHSYDHRVVDGALGGSFVRRVADYLEQFDPQREV